MKHQQDFSDQLLQEEDADFAQGESDQDAKDDDVLAKSILAPPVRGTVRGKPNRK